MKLPVLFLLLCLGAMLSGCGQKGQLYLPTENPKQGTSEPATEPTGAIPDESTDAS